MTRIGHLLLLIAFVFPVSLYAGSPGNNWPDLSKPAPAQGGGEKDAALIIGISEYSSLPDIKGASENAREWSTYLTETRKVDPAKVFMLLDGEAYLESVTRLMENAIQSTQDGGTLWVIYIGHGYSGQDKDSQKASGLLVLHDVKADIDNINARSLSQDMLLRAINKGKQDQTILLLDACFSGKTPDGLPLIDTGIQVSKVAPDADDIVKRNPAPKKPKKKEPPPVLWLTATDKDQYAGPLPGTKRPAFSYLVLGAMRGWADDGDGKVTAQEAVDYAEVILNQAKDRTQDPKLKGTAGGGFVLSLGNEAKPSPTFNPIIETADPSKAEMVKINITSTPTGAIVLVNNQDKGETPLLLEREKSDGIIKIKVKSQGYETSEEIEVSLQQDAEKSFVLKALPPETQLVGGGESVASPNNKVLFSTLLGAGSVGAGLGGILTNVRVCREGDFNKGGPNAIIFSSLSGVLGGAAWGVAGFQKDNLLAPSLGASATMLLVMGGQFATFECSERRIDPYKFSATAGFVMLGAAAVDFAVWGIVHAKQKKSKEKKASLMVYPQNLGATLQIKW